MKKLFVIAAAALMNVPLTAQEKTSWKNDRSLLTISAGVAVPIMCYASKDINDRDDGFAKPGFSIDISYDYRLNNTIGMTGSVFYSFNKAGSAAVKTVSSAESYRVFGLMAGPVLSRDFSDRWAGDLRFMAGISRAMTPQLQYRDETILNSHSANAFTWRGGIGVWYNLGGNSFLRFNSDYTNLKPKFSLKAGETGKNEQHIVLINVDAGVGWKF